MPDACALRVEAEIAHALRRPIERKGFDLTRGASNADAPTALEASPPNLEAPDGIRSGQSGGEVEGREARALGADIFLRKPVATHERPAAVRSPRAD